MPRHLSSLLLVLCLTAGSPLIASPGTYKGLKQVPDGVKAAKGDLLGQVWHHFIALWAGEGCSADPDGARCAAQSVPPTGHTVVVLPPAPEGCGIDPNGCSH